MDRIETSLMLFTHYLFGYVGTVICSIGLVLSLCSFYIFTRRQMRSIVSTYLAGLSLTDSLLLLMGLVFAINSSIPPQQQSEWFYSSRLHKILFPYVYSCTIWFQFTSVWITVSFAVDRWFAIKWPMLHYTYSLKRACYIVIIAYCLGFIYSLPRFFEYKTEIRNEILDIAENYTEYIEHILIKNKFHNSTFYQYAVHIALYSLFQSILPLLMLCYFNIELIRSVNARSRFLKDFTSVYDQNTRAGGGEPNNIRYTETVITRSVICLIGVFIFCQVPASILHYIYMFYRSHKWLYICYDISNFLIFVNSAGNFFIFTCYNRKFRRELANVCSLRRTRKIVLNTSSRQSFKRTSLPMRGSPQNQFATLHSNKRQEQTRFINDRLQKKPSKSEFYLNTIHKRSDSLNSIRSSKNNRLKPNRYSMCEFNYKKSPFSSTKQQKFSNYSFQKSKVPAVKNFSYRHNSEKYSSNLRQNSLLKRTHDHIYYNQRQSFYYVKSESKYKSKIPLKQALSSTPTTTISNLTRSTVDTSFDSLYSIERIKLMKTLSNNSEQTDRSYRT